MHTHQNPTVPAKRSCGQPPSEARRAYLCSEGASNRSLQTSPASGGRWRSPPPGRAGTSAPRLSHLTPDAPGSPARPPGGPLSIVEVRALTSTTRSPHTDMGDCVSPAGAAGAISLSTGKGAHYGETATATGATVCVCVWGTAPVGPGAPGPFAGATNPCMCFCLHWDAMGALDCMCGAGARAGGRRYKGSTAHQTHLLEQPAVGSPPSANRRRHMHA